MSQEMIAPSLDQSWIASLPQMESLWSTPAFEAGYVTALTQTGHMLVQGDDAATFLHNQLSNDVERLQQGEMRRAAYCTAKGRMLASLVYWKATDGITLQLPTELLPAIKKRLGMFILRAKVTITDISAEHVVFALGGKQATDALSAWFPTLPPTENTTISNEYGTLIRYHADHAAPRYQWICPSQHATTMWNALTKTLQACNPTDWQLAEISAGIPTVTARTQEKFVPQMINFELIGGVNFKKGCYPGQEIVARSQYLGKLKRRMSLASLPAVDLVEGTEIFKESDPTQPCGMIVNVAVSGQQRSLALIEMSLADQEGGGLRCGSAEGPPVTIIPLPYEITDITR